MKNELNIGVVSEGATDYTLINEIVCSILDKDENCLKLQPIQNGKEPGWYGVVRFCREEIQPRGIDVFLNKVGSLPIHAVIVLVDGDQYVESTLYCAANDTRYCTKFQSLNSCYTFRTIGGGYSRCVDVPEKVKVDALPICRRVSAMRGLVLKWCGLKHDDPKLIISIPCDMIESWIVASLETGDQIDGRPIEEYPHIFSDYICANSSYYGWQTNLGKESFFKQFTNKVVENWDQVRQRCPQAHRFHNDLLSLISS